MQTNTPLSFIQRNLFPVTDSKYRDSWMDRVLRINNRLMLRPKQDIHTILYKAQGKLWKRGHKNMEAEDKKGCAIDITIANS